MKKENADLSRRSFLSKGASVAAASSIIAIPALAAPSTSKPASMGGDPVDTESVQTLINKTIPSYENILGSDNVNIKEYGISGSDITSALNDALTFLNGTEHGGTILIPHGIWTTNGNHQLPNSVTVEGVGYNANPGTYATEIKLNTGLGVAGPVFVINASTFRQNISLKNMLINLSENEDGIGLLIYGTGSGSAHVYLTHVENVGFYGGEVGVKVATSNHLEVILNSFDRVSFLGCETGFYCNSVNGGYHFSNCYFRVPAEGTAINAEYMGNLSCEHCLFGGSSFPTGPQTDGSTILKTVGAFNNITFYDCQDEFVEYYYQTTTNAWVVPIVLKNCIVQSSFNFKVSGSVVFDGCRINVTNLDDEGDPPDPTYQVSRILDDASSASVQAFYKGVTTFAQHESSPPPVPPHGYFDNVFSHSYYDANHVGMPEIASSVTNYYVINKSRGVVTIPSGYSYIDVENNLVNSNSIVFAQLRTNDTGGARIREVVCSTANIRIYLTQNAAANLSVGFMFAG